ncbi:hypothetical protein Pla110_25090 [Polystyrenella longa]|uniref:DUF3352 domain-containing protein n=1 Tax=Polystyrenella longa TaxID=2528007 RepID=A0A518CNK5_9PLAN|nr:DUF3352 domain-containing protein [Polystyrenella longa]QDU80774.1 hypothetical protein Pla110_25090 [Polystyrenella longa]
MKAKLSHLHSSNAAIGIVLLLAMFCLTDLVFAAENDQSPVGPTEEKGVATDSVHPADHYFPADALGLIRFGNVSAFRESWINSSFGAQINDPGLSKFFAGVVRQLDSLKKGLGVDVLQLIQQVDGELSIGLVYTSEGDMSVVAVGDFTDNVAAERWINQLEQGLTAEKATEITVEVESTQLKSWKRSSPQAVSNLAYFASGKKVIFSDSLQALAETHRRESNESNDRLSANEDYQHVMSRINPGTTSSGLSWYVDPETLVSTWISANLPGREAPVELKSMIEAIGINQVRGIGGTIYLGEAGLDSVSTTYGYMQTPLKGAMKALSLPATKQIPPSWVKEDVSLYSQMNWRVDRLFQTLRETVDQQRGEGAFDKALGSLPILDGKTNLAELAAAIDGPLHVAAEVPQAANELLRQNAIFGFGMSDSTLVRQLVREIAHSRETTIEKIGTAEVVRLGMDFGQSVPGFENMPPLDFAIAVTEDALLFSPNADYLAATFSPERSNMRSLADSPEYQQIAAQFPEETSVINYQRQDGRLEGLYNQLRSGLLKAGPMPGVLGAFNFDFEELPPFPAMSKYLQTTGSFVVPEEDGFRIVNFALPPREQ